ncbi:MAG: AAA family ATPase [Rhodospirillaceae bacterium]
MRLLAIRGRNLASLAEPFAVELAVPPLDSAGLFAITGPTGAGKSTILDALCLALFNRLPRLPGGAGTLLGREGDPAELRIATTDVRGVLRRGAGSGWAEVDFIGRDGVAYQARWEVWRARKRPGGKLQDVTQSLRRLEDGQSLGGTASETREEIERLLGLGFDQFRRSVLLAQGDFAAFLKAPARDRSALLERITGTGLYSRLSRAAYERAAAERQQLVRLEEKRAGLAVLDEAGRAALEAEAEAARAESLRAEQAAAAARAARAWHRRLADLEGEREAAATAYTAAAAARDAAEEMRREWQAVQRAQSLRPARDGSDAAAAEAAAARRHAGATAAVVAAARLAHGEAVGRLTAAEDRLRQAEAARVAIEPELEQALLLERDLQRLAGDVAEATAAQRRAAALAECERTALAGIDRELPALSRNIDRRRTALADRSELQPVAAEWPRWASTLDRAAAALATLVDSPAGLSGQTRPVSVPAATYDRSLPQAEAELAEKLRNLADIDRSPLPASDGLRAARIEAEGRRERVRTLLSLTDAAARSVADRSNASTEAVRLRDQSASAAAAAMRAESGLGADQAALAEAEAALRRLDLARSGEVEALRGALAAGEPCPVCGAGDHPWAGRHGAVFDSLAGEQQQRVDSLRAEVRRLIEALGGHRERATALLGQAEGAEARAAAAAAELGRLAASWRAVADAELPPDPAAEGLAALLAERLAGLEREIARIAGEEQAAAAHRRQVAAAEAAVREARAVCDLARVLAELAAPLAGITGWRAAWAKDAAGFRRRLGADVVSFNADVSALAEAEGQHQALVGSRAALDVRAGAAAEALAAATARLAEIQAGHGQATASRRGLLGGRSVAAVRQETATAVAAAGRERSGAVDGHRECELALARAVQAADSAAGDAERRAVAAAAARGAFEAVLAAAGTGEIEARHLLGREPGWIAETSAKLAALDRALERAATTLEERQRQVASHREAGAAPEESAAACEAALAAAEAALGTAREQAYALGVRVRQDDEARAGQAGMAAAIAAQRQVWELWSGLDEVIGSAGGDKFRKFAQGLSLDQLLGHANAQLADLARRYRLERAAGSDLEIQVVDRDMGDEVRSVHSLSGGETFLISLALALGLSALAGGGAGIGTLFIDEGFGALDPDSLDVALSCLEAMQAAGRSVGVVSHVPAMIERIGVQVRVIAEGGGKSRVVTVRGG